MEVPSSKVICSRFSSLGPRRRGVAACLMRGPLRPPNFGYLNRTHPLNVRQSPFMPKILPILSKIEGSPPAKRNVYKQNFPPSKLSSFWFWSWEEGVVRSSGTIMRDQSTSSGPYLLRASLHCCIYFFHIWLDASAAQIQMCVVGVGDFVQKQVLLHQQQQQQQNQN